MSLDQLSDIDPKTRSAFRAWLRKNHEQRQSVWIKVYKKHTEAHLIRTVDVVEECLCFGWIDSRPRKNDADSFFLLISPRREKSVWSAVNKLKVKDLVRRKQMTSAGLSTIKLAKKNGSWNTLNASDRLEMPVELKREFSKNPTALQTFNGFSRSSRQVILAWLYAAKTKQTLLVRVRKTLAAARGGLKVNIQNVKSRTRKRVDKT